MIARALALQESIKLKEEKRLKTQEARLSKNQQTKTDLIQKILSAEAQKVFDDRVRELEVPRMGYFDLVPNEDANTEVLTNE